MVDIEIVKEIIYLFKSGMQDIHCLDRIYNLLLDKSYDVERVKYILTVRQNELPMDKYPFKIADFERVVETVSDEDEIHEFITKANLLLEKIVFFNLENVKVIPKKTDKYFVNYIDILHMYGILEDTSYTSLRIHGADHKLNGLKFSNIELLSDIEFDYSYDNIDYGIFTPAGVLCISTLLSSVISYLLHFGVMYYNETLNEEYDGKYIYKLLSNTFDTCELSIEEFCLIILGSIAEVNGGSEYIKYLKSILDRLKMRKV